MKGLIYKDSMIIKNQMKYFVLLTVFYVLVIGKRDLSAMFSLMSVFLICFVIMIINTFSYDDMFKWNSFAAALPVKRSQIVLSKYLLVLMLSTMLAAVSIILMYLFGAGLSIAEILLYTVAAVEAIMVYVSIFIPCIYKMGVQKARFIMLIPLLFISLMSINSGRITNFNVLKIIMSCPVPSFLIYSFVSVIIIAASYFMALKIFSSKEL